MKARKVVREVSKRDWLIERRKKIGMTQQDVANLAGVTCAAYCHYEKGRRTPPPRIAERLGGILGLDKTLFYFPN